MNIESADYFNLTFDRGEIVVDQPLLTVDRQMGLVIVTPEGKVCRARLVRCVLAHSFQEAKTVFEIMNYDKERDQSVVRCLSISFRRMRC